MQLSLLLEQVSMILTFEQGLQGLGLDPDFKANRADGEKFISKPDSKVKALIVPANEELMIAREIVRVRQ